MGMPDSQTTSTSRLTLPCLDISFSTLHLHMPNYAKLCGVGPHDVVTAIKGVIAVASLKQTSAVVEGAVRCDVVW